MTGRGAGLSRGMPQLPDPDGDARLWRLKMNEIIRDLYRRTERLNAGVSELERVLASKNNV